MYLIAFLTKNFLYFMYLIAFLTKISVNYFKSITAFLEFYGLNFGVIV
jgi:hypothetical protein